MKVYIGLGGIGIRTLKNYALNCSDEHEAEYYYIDTNIGSVREFIDENSKNVFIVPNLPNGTSALRCIGRNMVFYNLFAGHLMEFFSDLKNTDEIELIFVLSSFGGFGGAALFPVLNYLEAITWNNLKSCNVFAFNENAYANLGFPQPVLQLFETNTIEFVSDYSALDHSRTRSLGMQERNMILFNPGCKLHLIDTRAFDPDDFWKCIDLSEEELGKLNCKDRYRVSRCEQKGTVFISYSSKDQIIADLIVEKLDEACISSWIATRNIGPGSYAKQIIQGIRNADIFLVLISKNSIKSEHVKNEINQAFKRITEGLNLLPFILDDSELDDECQYYLCRQEMINGTLPPIEARINELIEEIQKITN